MVVAGDPDDTCADAEHACDGAGLCLAVNGAACAAETECLSHVCASDLCEACTLVTACPDGKSCDEVIGICN